LSVVLSCALSACGDVTLNNPYPAAEDGANTLYSSFSERPKHLDPVQAYSSNEVVFTGQIYEPPLQYHYLKRPYTLEPLTITEVPVPVYLDADGAVLPDDADSARIAYSVYEFHLRPGILYQPHPAFARDADGQARYLSLSAEALDGIDKLSDFAESGTRELVAADYVYEIKRLAHPHVHSPIYGLMSEYIVGLKDYAATLREADSAAGEADGNAYIDLERYPLEGAQVIDRYTWRVKLHGTYPQLLYWMAMPFFAPIPPEADRFYSQPGMTERNITLDWYPVGTGPYMLTVNNPNLQMVLQRNPNFHGETYPAEGNDEARRAGLLADAGKPIPFIDRVVYSLEQESIPYWNKFLQGYYDVSGIASDSFDQAISIGAGGEASLTAPMQAKGIELVTAVASSNWYMGFNMLDPVVGGYSARARNLRLALSIAIDYEEYIAIFLNGRGIPAQGPLPPGIFGYRDGAAGINSLVYEFRDGQARRKPIAAARALLIEAGYPNGHDAQTGEPLVLYFDTMASGPGSKSRLDWYRKQLAKLDIQLVVRDTDYNRFQEKMLKGTAQLFEWGWNADYPDPENFMFLLYGPNAKKDKNGENASNYDNPGFNVLFDRMKTMPNGPARQAVIDRMLEIVRHDAPWIWGFNPKDFVLHHAWYHNAWSNLMANNSLKYKRIDPALRTRLRAEWNPPVLWPLGVIALVLAIGTLPAVVTYLRKEHRPSLNDSLTAADAKGRRSNVRS
jgi:ABC-type transport system substrate-binding protein